MAISGSPASSRLHVWLLASRPRTLFAAVSPVVVGVGLAVRAGVFAPWAALAALLSALLIQIGANFANDLYDFKKGADPATRLGPTRVTSAGMLSPQTVQKGMWVTFGLAGLAGLYLVSVGGWPILVAGVAAVLSAIAYTGGPFPLGYHGLGDLFAFVFFGLVGVIGTYYVQANAVSLAAVVAAVPIGALVTAILVVNNVRDIDTDRAAGKRTLVVLLGRSGGRLEYLLLLAVAYLAPFVFWLGLSLSPLALLPILSLPMAARLYRTVASDTSGPALNRALAGTAQLTAVYAVLLAVGLVIG